MELAIVSLVVGIVGLIILSAVTAYLKQAKCPECGKRNCAEQAREQIGSEHISIQKEEKIQHYRKDQLAGSRVDPLQKHSPESVSVRKYTVPGKRIFFDVTYVCRVCGNEFSREEWQDVEI